MKYWVFDLDGTLVDSLTVHFHILEKVFNHFGREFTSLHRNEILKVNAKTLLQYFENTLGVKHAHEAHQLFKQLNDKSYLEIQPFFGIHELLNSLKEKEFKLAVWTARDIETTEKILVHTGLKDFFSIYVSASCVAEGKPHPEGLQKIANHFESDRESMVMVGDFDSDMLGAQAFGIKAIRVLWHNDVPFKKCEIASWQFHQVTDLANWVNVLNSRKTTNPNSESLT